MREKGNSKNEGDFNKDSGAIVGVLKRMQVKLDSMEEKIDSLLKQSKEKTFKSKQFSRPRKEFDKTKHYGERKPEGKKEELASEGKFYHGRPFGKKKNTGKVNLKKFKKTFKK